jgi:kanamycin kinase
MVLAGAAPVRPVWRNATGGGTFAIGTDRFVKFSPAGAWPDLAAEASRMRWAVRFTAVPLVLTVGGDEDGRWLVTAALPGRSAVLFEDDPATAVRAVGTGLRRLHDTLPVELCPFDWSTRLRVLRAERRGHRDPADWFPEHRARGWRDAAACLHRPPPIDRLVVCHGDACVPNTLVGTDGECTGHVDLGALGVADRWADLAVATWSTVWNFGPGWEDVLLDAYGIDPDPERTAYYRLLWDLSP